MPAPAFLYFKRLRHRPCLTPRIVPPHCLNQNLPLLRAMQPCCTDVPLATHLCQ
jgi:hypothetical protein